MRDPNPLGNWLDGDRLLNIIKKSSSTVVHLNGEITSRAVLYLFLTSGAEGQINNTPLWYINNIDPHKACLVCVCVCVCVCVYVCISFDLRSPLPFPHILNLH